MLANVFKNKFVRSLPNVTIKLLRKQKLVWGDPLNLRDRLPGDERATFDSARDFCDSKLQPRVLEANRKEDVGVNMMREMDVMGYLSPTLQGYGFQGVCYNASDCGLMANTIERVDSGYRSAMSAQFPYAMTELALGYLSVLRVCQLIEQKNAILSPVASVVSLASSVKYPNGISSRCKQAQRSYTTDNRKGVTFKFKTTMFLEDHRDDQTDPPTAPMQSFLQHSYADLLSWVRGRAVKFRIADLEVSTIDVQQHNEAAVMLDDEEAFKRLRTDTVYELKVRSLSMPFSSFNSYESVCEYAELVTDFITNESLPDHFPKVADTKMFAANQRIVMSTLVAILDNYSEMFSREMISPIWRQALSITNAQLTKSKSTEQSPPSALETLKYEFETQIVGKRAHGALDIITFFKFSIFLLFEAKDITMPVICGKYQALAQMVAARDRVVRCYCAKYPLLSEAQIKAVYDKYPSYGVVTSGAHWFLLKYAQDSNGVWWAEESKLITLGCTAPNTNVELKVLRESVARLLTYLSGASMLFYQHVLQFEQTLAAINAEVI